jgi:hypothetical protein
MIDIGTALSTVPAEVFIDSSWDAMGETFWGIILAMSEADDPLYSVPAPALCTFTKGRCRMIEYFPKVIHGVNGLEEATRELYLRHRRSLLESCY